MGTSSGRKAHYAQVMVEALELTKVPVPLDSLLDVVPRLKPSKKVRSDRLR